MWVTGMEEIKEDWEKVKKRYEAWWACELYDRVLVQVTAPREGIKPIPVEPPSVEAMWTDIDYMIRELLKVSAAPTTVANCLPRSYRVGRFYELCWLLVAWQNSWL